MPPPEKLKKDAILEAICEVRFETDELDELVIGRLSESVPWEKFARFRLPMSDLPAPVRKSDVNLRYQPIVELRDSENPRAVKIGSNVISAHMLAPYCGWHIFQPQLHEVLDILFAKFKLIQLPRIGLRYINAIVPTDHHIKDINALKLEVSIDGAQLNVPFSLAYSKATEDTVSVVKLASPALVIGSTLPPNFIALIDVDVSTPDTLVMTDPQAAKDWLERAHATEKEEFFRLWPEDALTEARER